MFKTIFKQKKKLLKIKDLNKYVWSSLMFLIYKKPQVKSVSGTTKTGTSELKKQRYTLQFKNKKKSHF